jgi:hypothetical protein
VKQVFNNQVRWDDTDELAIKAGSSAMRDEGCPNEYVPTTSDGMGDSGIDLADNGSSVDNVAKQALKPAVQFLQPASAKTTKDCVGHDHKSAGAAVFTKWALTVAERRLIWLRRKHPKMNRHKLQLWASRTLERTR